MAKHQKHAKLTKPHIGRFARNEWAIVGAPCSVIQELARDISVDLQRKHKWSIAYVDADHASGKETEIAKDFTQIYTDKIKYHEFAIHENVNEFEFRRRFNQHDLVLVNGNHFPASRQIIVISKKKEESLRKRIDQLTNVDLVLLEKDSQIFPWLHEHIDIDAKHVIKLENIEKIREHIENSLLKSKPGLHGLVLAGGKSLRMQKDKGLLNYHGKSQRAHVAEMMQSLCDQTFYSFRQDQEVQDEAAEEIIRDSFLGLGPFGAILSAFRMDPNAAWLAVACDYPLLDREALTFLVENRDPSKLATCFYNPETKFPEPTITIWEPKAYPVLLEFLANGYSCARKVLINSNCKVLKYHNSDILRNVNTPEEFEAVNKQLNA